MKNNNGFETEIEAKGAMKFLTYRNFIESLIEKVVRKEDT